MSINNKLIYYNLKGDINGGKKFKKNIKGPCGEQYFN